VTPSTPDPGSAKSAAARHSESDVRTTIVDVAERLFAERGFSGVSLREINNVAGQRNASAIQYHFGNREGLVRAVFERHLPAVDAERNRLLDEYEAGADPDHPDGRAVMYAVVAPLADRLRTPSGRCYVRVLQHFVDEPTLAGPLESAGSDVSSLTRTTALLTQLVAHFPEQLLAERHSQVTSFLLRAVADRATDVDTGHRRRTRINHDAFVENLVDVLLAVLVAPPSPETSAALTRHRR
jgi:AcrR family transcriptional regulator